jgi:arginyl-tRNA synthetase
MIQFKAALKNRIFLLLKDKYPVTEAILDIAYTPQARWGDLALAFPFQLARAKKRPPRELAAEIAPLLESLEGIAKVDVAGAGYINLYIDRASFFRERLSGSLPSSLQPDEKKIIIEHTNINPNKAAHIGHLRNAVLGDTLARCLNYKGENVEVQNYIDDTGVQVVDVVFGFIEMEKMSLEDIAAIEDRFDYFCWDLYTRVTPYLEAHPEAAERKQDILRRMEEGEEPESSIAHFVSRRILKAHLKTMKRLGITYDVLPCESTILGLNFWEKAFDSLKEKKAVFLAADGPNKGCWVMRLEEEEEREKVIVRSDGTVTYVGKDIAYQMWKFGLLDRDFIYRPFIRDNGRTIWITVSEDGETPHRFGGGSLVYNVIDTRQSYLQKIVVQGLKSLGYEEQAKKSIHYSYEMVALSPNSLKELGIPLNEEDRDKSFLEVSGRKGLGVKADDLLDRLESKALKEVEGRNPNFPPELKRHIAQTVAVGALRYFMLKFTKNSLIIFDFDEVLSFEGETGPYLQYTYVRINSIFRNLEEKEGFGKGQLAALIKDRNGLRLGKLSEKERDDFWEGVLLSTQNEEEILHSIHSLEFSHLAKYSFNLCQKFNAYYHKYSILAEKDPDIKHIRILTIHFIQNVLSRTLALMGIPTPDRM